MKYKPTVKINTRDQILRSARELFNHKTVHQTSMREIAAKAGICIGNLTYYFPHKQDLILALMQENGQEAMVEGPFESLSDLESIFSNMLDSLTRNPFFFLNHDLRHMCSEQDENIRQMVQSQLDVALDALIAKGLFQPDFSGSERATVLHMLKMTHITWLEHQIYYPTEPNMTKRELLDAHWTILKHYLTPAGLHQLSAMQAGQ